MSWLTRAVVEVLDKTLGAFVDGIDGQSLKLSVWTGDIKLRGLRVKADAIETLLAEASLPVRVVGATLNEIQVTVPWRNLGSEPMVVRLDRVFIILAAKEVGTWDEAEELAKAERVKRERLAAWEVQESRKNSGDHSGSKMVDRLVRAILQKIEVHVTNVHICIQGSASSDSQTLEAGVVLRELHILNHVAPNVQAHHSANNVSAKNAKEVTSSAAKKQERDKRSVTIRKSAHILGFAAYLHGKGTGMIQELLKEVETQGGATMSKATRYTRKKCAKAKSGNACPTKDATSTPTHGPAEWDEVMMPMIQSDVCPAHVLEPLGAKVNLTFDPSVVVDSEIARPRLEVELAFLTGFSAALRHSQFLAILHLLDGIGRMARQHRFRHCGRPEALPSDDPGAWWAYAARAVTVQRRTERIFVNWAELSLRRQYRLMYVDVYTSWLSCPEPHFQQQIMELEDGMSLEDIIRYRTLGRAAQRAAGHKRNSSGDKRWQRQIALEDKPAHRRTGSEKIGVEDKPGHRRTGSGNMLSEEELQRLQESLGLDVEGGCNMGTAEKQYPPAYVQLRASVSFPAITFSLYMQHAHAPIVQLRFDGVHASFRFRPASNGIGLQATVHSFEVLDPGSPWPQLRTVCAAGGGDGGVINNSMAGVGDFLTLACETEPLHSDASMLICGELQPVRLLLNPQMLSPLRHYFDVPQSQWQIVSALETKTNGAIADFVHAVRTNFNKERRPLNVQLRVHGWRVLVVEPPPLSGPVYPDDVQTSPLSQSENEADIDFSLDAAAAIAATTIPREASESSEDPFKLTVGPMLELRLGGLSFESEEISGSDAATSHAFILKLRNMCAALLPDTDPATWIAAASEIGPEVDKAWLLILPLDVRLQVAITLQGGSPDDPLIDCELEIDPLVIKVREKHLLTIVTLLIGIAQSIQPVCERDENGLTISGGKSGWLQVKERRSVGGRIELSNLGVCWVYLAPGHLWYEREHAGSAKRRAVRLADCSIYQESTRDFTLVTRYETIGMEYEWSILLRASSRSEAAQWMSACAAMQSSSPSRVSRSLLQRGMSDVALRQVHVRVYAILPELSLSIMPSIDVRSGVGTRKPSLDALANAQNLNRTPTRQSTGTPSCKRTDANARESSAPALIAITLSHLSGELVLRAHDANCSVRVGLVSGTASAGTPARSMPLLLSSSPCKSEHSKDSNSLGSPETALDDGPSALNSDFPNKESSSAAKKISSSKGSPSNLNAILDLKLAIVSPSSQLFEEGSAQVKLSAALRSFQVHLVPSVVHRVLHNVLRVCQQMDAIKLDAFSHASFNFRGVAPGAEPKYEEAEVSTCTQGSLSSEASLQSLDTRHASSIEAHFEQMVRMQRVKSRQDLRGTRNSAKPVVDIAVQFEPISVLLHEESAPPIGCADASTARAAALCDARMNGLSVCVVLQEEGFDVQVVVHSILLLARNTPDEPPVELITLLRPGKAYPKNEDAEEHKKSSPFAIPRRSLSVPQSMQEMGQFLNQASAESSGMQHAPPKQAFTKDDASVLKKDETALRQGSSSTSKSSSTWSNAASAGVQHSSDPQMLSVRVKSLDGSQGNDSGSGIEASVTLLPVRILLGPCFLVRSVQVCVDDLLKGLKSVLDRLEAEAMALALDVLKEEGPPVKLNVKLHGPLIVLPRKSMSKAALLLRMADVTANTEIVQRDHTPVTIGKRKGKDCLHIRFSNAQLLVACGAMTLDENWMVRESYEPSHWVLQDIQIHLKIEQKPSLDNTATSPTRHNYDCGEQRPALDPSPGTSQAGKANRVSRTPALHLHIMVSPIQLSLACTECVFVLALLQELLPIFFPPDLSRPSAESHTKLSRVRGDNASEAGVPIVVRDDLNVQIILECEQGPQIRLLDDSQGALLPLFNVVLKRLDAHARLTLREQPRGSDAEPLIMANVKVALQLAATHLNVNNGYWEPLIEPWNVELQWDLGTDEENQSKQQLLQVLSNEPLEVDVTHAMLRALISTVQLMIQASTTTAEADDTSSLPGHDDRQEHGIQSLAVCNMTDVPLLFKTAKWTDQTGYRIVASGETLPFASSFDGAIEESPHASTDLESETIDSVELVMAAKNGDVELAAELLRRGAQVDSLDARGRSPLHRAAQHQRLEMVQLLIRAAANIELPTADSEMMRPLHFAARAGAVPIVLTLLAHGADPGAANASGQNAAGMADAYPHLQDMLLSELHEATSLGKRFPSAQLVAAAARGDVARCRALLLAGADPDSNDGRLTALQRAVSERQISAVRMLLQAGATVGLVSIGKGTNGATALHFAARVGTLSLVQMLLAANANPTQAAADGALPHESVIWRTRDGPAVRELLRSRLLMQVILAGWLTKLGGERKTWRARYAILLPDQLRYYGDQELTDPRGRIDLTASLLEDLRSPSSYPGTPTEFSFEMGSGDRTYVFCVKSKPEITEWLRQLRQLTQTDSDRPRWMVTVDRQVIGEDAPGGRSSPSITPPCQRHLHVRRSNTTSLAPEATASDTAGLRAGELVTISLGDEFEPLYDVPMRPLGTTMMLLYPKGDRPQPNCSLTREKSKSSPSNAALGLICDVRLRRGRRTLTVKSTVEVLNETDEVIQLQAQCLTLGAKDAHLLLQPGELRSLPLNLTKNGSYSTCWELLMRPTSMEGSESERHYMFGSLVAHDPGTALLSCSKHPTKEEKDDGHNTQSFNARWMCCGTLEHQRLDGSHLRSSIQQSSEKSKRILSRYSLPSSEVLIESWPCLVYAHLLPKPAMLHLTTSYLCYHSTIDRETEALPWEQVEQMHTTTSLGALVADSIEVVLQGGRRITFSGLLSRDAIYRQLHAVRMHARTEWASGLTHWKPWRLRLTAPLQLHNLLPCGLHIALRQLSAIEWERISKIGGVNKASLSAEGTMEVLCCLAMNASIKLHELHLLTPLRLRIWIGDDSYESAQMRGKVCLEPPSREGPPKTMTCELQAARSSSSLALPLKICIAIRASKSGACAISFWAQYWLKNESSVPLRVYDAGSYGATVQSLQRARHIVESAPHSDRVIPFSLGSDVSSVRLGVPPMSSASMDSADAASRAYSQAADDSASLDCVGVNGVSELMAYLGSQAGSLGSIESGASQQLSKAFSVAAIGSDGALDIGFSDGSVAEVSVQISRAKTSRLASATEPSTVVTLQDRFVLRNLSDQHLEWRQTQSVEAQHIPAGLPHSLPPDSRSEVPLRWSSGSSQRLLSVRTRSGSHEWSPGFSPSTVGESVIKLRPCVHYAAAAKAMGMEEDSRVTYLRLTVSMDKVSSRRILVIRSVCGIGAHLRLPYLIKNDSSLLVAFRQTGSAHWDFLGAGEAAEYAWDAPLATRLLNVHVRDMTCCWQTETTGISLERLEQCADMKLDQTTPTKVVAQTALPGKALQDSMVVSVACMLRYGDESDAKAEGWLCVTSKLATFVFFANGAAARHSANQKALQQQLAVSPVKSAASSIKWVNLHELPMAMEDIASVSAMARPGELLLRTVNGGQLVLANLRDPLGTRERMKKAWVDATVSRFHSKVGSTHGQRPNRGLKLELSGTSYIASVARIMRPRGLAATRPLLKAVVSLGHSKGPLRELRLFDQTTVGVPTETTAIPVCDRFECLVKIERLGVALVDEEPREILYLALRNITLRSALTYQLEVELSLGHVQVDSALAAVKFPVMLAPMPPKEGDPGDSKGSTNHDGCLHVSFTQDTRYSNLLYLEYFGAALQPLRLQLEQNTLARLFRFVASLNDEIQLLLEALAKHFRPKEFAVGDVQQVQSLDETAGGAVESGQGNLSTGPQADAAPVRSEGDAVTEEFVELYLKQVHLHPISITCTVQLEPLCDEDELQEYHPTISLVGPARHLVSLQNAQLNLKALLLEGVIDSADSLIQRIVWHYTKQILQSVYKVVGSLDLIGNPANFFSDVGGGVKDFYYEPRKGLVKSPSAFTYGLASGTTSLLSGVFIGGAAGVLSAASAGTTIVGHFASALTFDPQYRRRRQLLQQQHAARTSQGIYMGLEALSEGIIDGVTGVFEQPIRGAIDGGPAGFARGVGRGLVGIVAKPMSGLAGLASKTTEGIASDARMMTPGMRSLQQQLFLRMRQPRLIGPNNVLLAYPRKLPSLHVDMRPLIQRSKASEKAEQQKLALPVQKFHQAWRRAMEQESLLQSAQSDATEHEQSEQTRLENSEVIEVFTTTQFHPRRTGAHERPLPHSEIQQDAPLI